MRKSKQDRRAAAIAGMLSTTNATHVQVVDKKRETLAEFTARYNAEQKAAEETKMAKALEPLNQTIRELANAYRWRTKTFWGKPMSEVYNAEGGSSHPFAYDEGIVLDDAPDDSKFDVKVIGDALSQFTNRLFERQGFALTRSGLEKLWAYGQVLAHRGKTLSTPEAWQVCFERLQECKALLEDEVNYDPEWKPGHVVAPAPKLTTEDLLAVDANTREGRMEADRIATDLGNQLYAPLFSDWIVSLQNNFGFAPNETQCKKVVAWFQRNNLSFGDHRNYDAARRWMVSTFEWPESMLTPEEKLAREIEATPLSTSGFDTKRDLIRRIRQD